MVSDDAIEVRLDLGEVIQRARRYGIDARELADEFKSAFHALDMAAKWEWDEPPPQALLH